MLVSRAKVQDLSALSETACCKDERRPMAEAMKRDEGAHVAKQE
jgi:hypothetical protein